MDTITTAQESAASMVGALLAQDGNGDKIAPGTVAMLTALVTVGKLSPIDAAQRGKARERADLLAFLRKRRGSALKVAAGNPEEAERAEAIAAQIGIEIEAIEQGLHEGEATVAGEIGA